MTDWIFFYAFALLTLAGAVLTVTRRNPVHSAVWLIVSLLGVAGLYLLQSAEFLFAVQIVLYIGGIMVLFLFVIMLVNLDQLASERQFNRQWILGLVCVVMAGAQLVFFITRGSQSLRLAAPFAPGPAKGNVEAIAEALFSRHALPFEAVSLLLLAAVVGSVLMAKKDLP